MLDITLPRSTLLTALESLDKAAAPKSCGVPILRNLYFAADGTSLLIEATDGMLSMRTTIPATDAMTTKGRGTLCIPSDVIGRVRAMSDGPINIRETGDNQRVTVSNVGLFRRFDLFGMQGQDWPQLAKMPTTEPLFTAPAAELLFMLRNVELATNSDESKIAQNCANVIFGNGRLEWSATDGARMHRVVRTNTTAKSGQLLITRRTLSAMRHLLDDAVKGGITDVSVLPMPNAFAMKVGSTEFIAKQASAEPVDLSFILKNQKWGDMIQVNRVALLECIRAIAIVATPASGMLLTYEKEEPTTLFLTSSDPDTGNGGDSVECISIKAKWGGLTTKNVALAPALLREALDRMSEETVTLSITGHLEPVVIIPGAEVPESPADAGQLCICMPMNV